MSESLLTIVDAEGFRLEVLAVGGPGGTVDAVLMIDDNETSVPIRLRNAEIVRLIDVLRRVYNGIGPPASKRWSKRDLAAINLVRASKGLSRLE